MKSFVKHSDNGFEPLNLWLINRIFKWEICGEANKHLVMKMN
jgi:hypothetical protein